MRTVSVTQVNEYIARKLRDDFNLRGLAVEGEISALSSSGPHMYLTLKDKDSLIKCVIWASNLKNIDRSILENGKKIICLCDISPYAKTGTYSLSIKAVEASGEGALMAEFNRIKEKLFKEGLFDSKYKKPIPNFPLCVGVITSDTGAAIEDIKKIIKSKNNLTDIIIFPTQVQGIGAEQSIINNIRRANEAVANGIRIDTLIVGRGGGAPEDLMAFNDEGVARAIFESEIPIISAVGHESDISISDFVADLRAETPTAAAELAVMNTYELSDEVNYYLQKLTNSMNLRIKSERNNIQNIVKLLNASIKNKIASTRLIIEKAAVVIEENNPEKIFSKGYAAIMDQNDDFVSTIDSISLDKEYKIRLKDGEFKAKVTEKEKYL